MSYSSRPPSRVRLDRPSLALLRVVLLGALVLGLLVQPAQAAASALPLSKTKTMCVFSPSLSSSSEPVLTLTRAAQVPFWRQLHAERIRLAVRLQSVLAVLGRASSSPSSAVLESTSLTPRISCRRAPAVPVSTLGHCTSRVHVLTLSLAAWPDYLVKDAAAPASLRNAYYDFARGGATISAERQLIGYPNVSLAAEVDLFEQYFVDEKAGADLPGSQPTWDAASTLFSASASLSCSYLAHDVLTSPCACSHLVRHQRHRDHVAPRRRVPAHARVDLWRVPGRRRPSLRPWR